MSASDTFAAMRSGDFRLLRWIEIEGLPYCYGTGPGALSGTFFSGRSAAEQFSGIRCWLRKPPPVEDVELDVLEAFPKRAGAIEAEIVDVDGSVCALANTDPGSARLSADLAAGGSSLVYVGDDPGFSAPGVAYIGNETIAYTSHNAGTKTLSGITRGQFRSVDRAWGRGTPVHVRPYTLAKRRVWYYTIASTASAGSSATFGFTETNKWLRFSGTLDSFRATEDLTTFRLQATSVEKELDRDVFRELRQFEGPATKIRGPESTEGLQTGGHWSAPGVSAKLAEDEIVAVRCESEIMLVQRFGTAEYLRLLRRGLMSTKVEEHPSNATMREVVLIAPGVAGPRTSITNGTQPETSAAVFFSYPNPGDAISGGTWFGADHPIAVLLTVLLSGHEFSGGNEIGGDGFSTPYRRFDTAADDAPAAWFLGIDARRLDLRAIFELANETAWLRVSGVVEESTNFLAWAKQLLQPFGFYMTYTAEGLLTIRALRPPLPTADVRGLGDSHRLRVTRPTYDSNLSAVVSSVEYRYGWDIAESRFRRIVSIRVSEGALYSGGRGRSLVYESRFLYTGRERIPGELSRDIGFDVNELLRQRADFFQTRFARPPAIIIETVKLDLIDIALGDVVAITSTNSPSPSGGARGLDEALAEVIGKRVDEIEKTIELTLLLTGFELGDYRVIGPAAITQAVAVADVVIPLYTEAPGSVLGGRLGWYDFTRATSPIVSTIGGNEVTHFPDTTFVRRYPNLGTAAEPRWDFETYDVWQVDSTTPGTPAITLTTAKTTADGDLIVLHTYPSVFAEDAGLRRFGESGDTEALTLGEVFAFMSDNNGLLTEGVGTVEGHKWVPS